MSELFSGQVTELGGRVDTVQFFLILVMAFWFVACNAVLVYFMLKYRRKSPDQKVSNVKGNHLLEMAWTVIPTIMVIVIFVYGINVWTDLRTPPEDAMQINVTAQRWSWGFKYPNGRTTAGDLYVPQGVPVKLNMLSSDVLHSLFIPEFRVKEDVVPSLFTHLWFQAEKVGIYNLFCTEYCGDDHSAMLGKVHVLDPDTWERFEKNLPLDPNAVPLTPLENGKELFTKRACIGCHSIDGSPANGPTFLGIYGKQETLSDGSVITVDDNYIMESIKRPNVKLVQGYPTGLMPAFEGQLSDEDIADIITYIKTLK